MKLNLVFAITKDNVFGVDNRLPWISCKEDLQQFNRLTTNIYNQNYIIMGKNTWLSLPKKLENRINIVISKTLTRDCGCDLVFESLQDFFDNITLASNKQFFIIGGKSLIEEAMTKYKNIIDNIYISVIKKDIIEGENKVILNKFDFQEYLQKVVKKEEVDFYHYRYPEHPEYQYIELLKDITVNGEKRLTRNGYTVSLFSKELSFDLTKGFPLLTTKKMYWKGIVEELLFFIRGNTNSKLLEDKKVNIWKDNTSKEFIKKTGLLYEEGDMGNMYGFQWRHFGADYIDCNTDYSNKGIDQLEQLINEIKTNPTSRRLIITDFNPAQAHMGVLYPCHSIVLQFYVSVNNLSVKMYQRSLDAFLGAPFNIASTSLLLCIIAKLTNMKPHMVHITIGDAHLYSEHIKEMQTQLKRVPYDLCTINIPSFRTIKEVEDSQFEDYKLINYNCHQPIKVQMIA